MTGKAGVFLIHFKTCNVSDAHVECDSFQYSLFPGLFWFCFVVFFGCCFFTLFNEGAYLNANVNLLI